MNTSRRTVAFFAASIAALTLAVAACTPPSTTPAPTTSSTTTTSTVPAGPAVTVTPTSGLSSTDATITVTGRGFNPAGTGIYVAFGPKRADFSTNAANYQVVKWVWATPSGSPGQAKLQADGSFSVVLDGIDATYTDGNGTAVNCAVDACQVLTFAAHGSTNRSQDTFTPVSFG